MRFAKVARVLGIMMLAFGGAMAGCSDAFDPLSHANAPAGLTVEAVRLNAVRLTWTPVQSEDVVGYTIERRANLTGPFVMVADNVQQDVDLEMLSWMDTDVEPETYYGYRVVAVTRFGDRSGPSVIGGAKTPPMPGIDVSMTTSVPSADANDPDGYEITITGPDTIRSAIGLAQRQRFAPLRPGRYDVKLGGLIARCTADGAATQTVDVTDTLATTITPVTFGVTCRDPKRGDIRVTLTATGRDVDQTYSLALLGEASDAALPDAERIVSQNKSVTVGSPNTAFENLRPGTYDVTLQEIASNCQVTGTAKRTVQVSALGTTNIAYNVSCTGPGPEPGAGPYFLRQKWSSATAAQGQTVKLVTELDLTANSAQRVQGVQATIQYDPAVLRFEMESAGQLPALTVSSTTPGTLSVLAAAPGTTRSGVVKVAEFEFTVIGATGTSSTTTTTIRRVASSSDTEFQSQVSAEEGTITVSAGAVNQPPNAEANGPYTGTVGTAVSVNATGSTDSDGTIASYAWNFGDGGTGSGQSASHTYASAGTYTVTLTVTDNKGATDTDQATVTVTAVPSNTPPVAQANGPYSATVGIPLTLSSAGSSDPNGSIASYAWAFGNGQTGTGASPSVTYSSAGTYTVTLTVTDNQGATSTDQATVTVVVPPDTKPLIWKTVFGPVDVVNNIVSVTVSYDLRTSIPETPGIEVLQSFTVDSLKWDPSLLQFSSINLGPNVTGTSNQANVFAGNLKFSGSVSGALAQGLITVATIRFKIVGPTGAHAVTSTHLGNLQGAASTGNYIYNAKTKITEGEITLP